MDTLQVQLAARVMNFMGYDAGTVGNHDIETGPRVYDRIRESFQFPWLAASACYNFSSAAGINYTVDVSRLPGDRVTIQGFSDGASFEENESYHVAINSCRGNGGGGYLTRG